MDYRPAQLLAIAIAACILTSPAPAVACGNSGENPQAQAEQAITWASSLVEWHARRRVATAEPTDAEVRAVHAEALGELTEARTSFDGGMYPQALTHARNVEVLLDN